MRTPFLQPSLKRSALLVAALIGAGAVGYRIWAPSRGALVVYCAHDSIYSEKILRDFEQRAGIPILIRYDTEATKSLGLVELLLQEKEHPRCDVFWNNEPLGTLELAEQGLLQPYKGPGFSRIPERFRDPDGRWAGFAARLRVWIVNPRKLTVQPDAVDAALRGDLSRVAIAKPLYGTTRAQYTALWQLWGADKLLAWHRDWRTRGVREVAGNAMVKDLVAEGVCDLGLTDTDDYFEALDEGKPVAMVPARLDGGATICIPNTVAIIAGTPRLESAEKLADYLLSAECEMALAKAKSRQIPLGAVEETALPEDVRQLMRWAAEAYPLVQFGAARQECLAWLKSEYRL